MSTTLRGIAWDHPRGYDSVAGASLAWCADHPTVRVEWSKRSLQAFADAPLAELARDYDLLVIDHPHIPGAARGGWLLPLDGRGRDGDLDALSRWSVGRSHETYRVDGHQYALAIDAAAQVAVYRPDLLAEPPRSWEEVLAFAPTGRMLWPAKPVDAVSSFLTVAANLGSPCAAGPGAFVERETGLAVLDRLHRLADAVPAFCLEANPIEVAERLAASDTWLYAPLTYGYVNYSRAGFRAHRLAYADMPAGPGGPSGACLGGAGIAVSAESRESEPAVALAFWLASPAVQKGVYYRSGGQPAHRAAWEDPDLNADALGFFANTTATLDRSWVRPRFPGWLTVQDEAGSLINRALRRQLDDRQCLSALAELYVRESGAANR